MPAFNPHLLSSRDGRRARLDGIAERLSGAVSGAQVARILVDETSSATAACSMLYLLGSDADHLRVAASRGLSHATIRRLATVPLTCPLPFAMTRATAENRNCCWRASRFQSLFEYVPTRPCRLRTYISACVHATT